MWRARLISWGQRWSWRIQRWRTGYLQSARCPYSRRLSLGLPDVRSSEHTSSMHDNHSPTSLHAAAPSTQQCCFGLETVSRRRACLRSSRSQNCASRGSRLCFGKVLCTSMPSGYQGAYLGASPLACNSTYVRTDGWVDDMGGARNMGEQRVGKG